jgi:Ni,Fe-hydrogenase maturation factor
MHKIIILGYGNVDRQDDGIAWHVLCALANRLGRPLPDVPGEGFEASSQNPDLLFMTQLVPEISETLADYDLACFIDAHTGNIAADLAFEEIQGSYKAAPFTHHMTPQTCLSLAGTLFGHQPRGFLVTVRGYEFQFTPTLSTRSAPLADQAAGLIWDWLVQMQADSSPL